MVNDDLGTPVDTPSPARRVVSLVPSLTEAIAATRPEALVGATDWCTRPTGLDVPRVRGTKNPDLAAIRALEPDLVVANREENRELDVRRLREAGVPVWVSVVETVPQALMALRRLFEEALDWEVPDWLTEVEDRWEVPEAAGHRPRRGPDLARPVDGRRAATPSPATCCAGSAGPTCTPTAARPATATRP